LTDILTIMCLEDEACVYFLLKTRALLMNQSYILVIFVLISYTLLGPLSVKFSYLGRFKTLSYSLSCRFHCSLFDYNIIASIGI
jgi:hypothetical protein